MSESKSLAELRAEQHMSQRDLAKNLELVPPPSGCTNPEKEPRRSKKRF